MWIDKFLDRITGLSLSQFYFQINLVKFITQYFLFTTNNLLSVHKLYWEVPTFAKSNETRPVKDKIISSFGFFEPNHKASFLYAAKLGSQGRENVRGTPQT